MRAPTHCSLLVLAAIAIAALAPSPAAGQGGMPSVPQSMFGNRKERDAEVRGPSLSATDEPVAEIRIVGNQKIPTGQILNQLQTRVGRPFDPALVQRDVRKLASRSWFLDIRPSYEQGPKGRIVVFTVVERPVIRYVEYVGNEGIRTKKLAKETGLTVGGSVDPDAVEDARRKLVSLYQRNGYNNVQVNVIEGNKPTDQGVTFIINEGTPQKVWKIEFVGNEFVSGRRLKTQIESKPPLMMVFKGFVDREQLKGDVDRLTSYYRSFGYFEARIGQPIVEYGDSGKWATITFVVHEGPRYQVEEVQFIGNKIFANTSLAMGLKLPAGNDFEQAKMNADVELIKEIYGSQGYVFADIKAEPIFLEEQGKLKLMYHIEEGKQWRIGNVYVHIGGDTPHTRIQTALNRLSIKPGEIADIREIHASERRLQASQLFMTDAARGIMPKITYRIQELDDTELANETGESTFRGQSPDQGSGEPGGGGREGGNDEARMTNDEGPPLLAPPGSKMYLVTPPAGFVPRDNQVDVHLHFESPQDLSPTARPHVVRRPPYEDTSSQPPALQGVRPAPAISPAPTTNPVQPAANPYQRLIVRTQSPYQPPSAITPPAPAPSVADRYNAGAYGGQAIGATGPAAAPVGSSPYAVPQTATAAVQPQVSYPPPAATYPPQAAAPAAPAAAYTAQVPNAPFGPPPQYGQPPQYGPAPGQVLAPDPNIVPITPQLRNPQIFPQAPVDEFTPMFPEPAVDVMVDLNEAQTGRLMVGAAVNSDAGLVGQILLDEQNFDWTRFPRSWDELLSGRAFRGAGQRFRIEAAPGTEVQRYLVSFQEPYLWDSPISFGLSGSFFDRRYRDWDEQRLGGRVSLGYQWTENDLSTAVSYRGESVHIGNVSDPSLPELQEVLGSNALHGFKLTIANDTRDSAFLATQGHLLQLELEQVVGTFIYPRAVLDARQYFLLRERPDHSGRHVLTAMTRVGITGSDTPIYENFFAGGFSPLRGFEFRGASPVIGRVKVGGEFMWINTLEYLFPLTADDMMHDVVFTDFGTVTPTPQLDDYRVAPGFGLRITVPAMGPAPIALDFAFPVMKADTDDTEIFSFFIGLQR